VADDESRRDGAEFSKRSAMSWIVSTPVVQEKNLSARARSRLIASRMVVVELGGYNGLKGGRSAGSDGAHVAARGSAR